MSRPKRWAAAVTTALEAVGDLLALQEEYQEWLDNMPENLQDGATADKLNEITYLDIEGAQSTLEEAEAADLPLGFGKD